MKGNCYIAGKITGLPLEEVKYHFEKGKKAVVELGYTPIPPLELPHDHDKSWESYMREDLKALLGCTVLYALPNWHESRGAKIEVSLAQSLGIPVIVTTV